MKLLHLNIVYPSVLGHLLNTTDGSSKLNSSISMNVVNKYMNKSILIQV